MTELTEDFSEGRIQFAFVKVKDPNTALPKHVLIAWCGEGVPERTKGYFTSHLNAVSKILHGYHVQITARSDSDLEPSSVMQKVSDASGAKYSAGDAPAAGSSGPPPAIKSKPVFTPTASGRVNPLVAARSRRDDNVDADGWGADAPPVTRTQIEKVESAYQPTKVDMGNLSRNTEPSRFTPAARDDTPSDVVGGGYKPVGKVDIAAIRAQAKNKQDDRPTIVKGAYEPVGKVDIAAIKARAQKPESSSSPAPEEEAPAPVPLADRAAAFSQPAQSERLTSLPKPKIGNKFGGGSSFTGTKAPAPGNSGGLLGPAGPAAQPVTTTSRTFANEGGKTPAQLWAEKKAAQGGSASSAPAPVSPAATSPNPTEKSGEWKSGYTGKSWGSVQTSTFGRGPVENVKTNDRAEGDEAPEHEEETTGAGGVSALRDRFKNSAPISAGSAPAVPHAAEPEHEDDDAPPPPVPGGSRPSGGFALPGLPSRPAPAEEEEEQEPEPESPIRVAQPVSRAAVPEPEPEPEAEPEPEPEPAPVPIRSLPPPAPRAPEPEPEPEPEPVAHAAGGDSAGGQSAVIIYDYSKDEDNEIDLTEGQMVTNIEQVDPDWWMGTNIHGESGLFPSAYVSLVEEEEEEAPPPTAARPVPAPAPEPAAPAAGGATATAVYDYEAAEDNGTFY